MVPEEVEDKDLPILHDWDEIWKAVRDKEKAKRREDKSMHDSEEAGEASAEPDSTTGTSMTPQDSRMTLYEANRSSE